MATMEMTSADAGALGGDRRATAAAAWRPPTRRETGTLPLARLRRVTEHIREHLDERLTLGRLGTVAYMSPYHFARLFQRTTGMPPHQFVVRTRIERATSLLAAPGMSIAGISRSVGFRTPSHFTTVFRRLMGVTPRAYRARLGGGAPRGVGGELAPPREGEV